MSVVLEMIALWICGVCPGCRRENTVECTRVIEETDLGDRPGHRYECGCGASEFVEDFQIHLAYTESIRWNRPGETPQPSC